MSRYITRAYHVNPEAPLSRWKKVLLWVVIAIFAFLFLAAGVNKLTSHPSITENFVGWGYAPWFLLLIGVVEVAGAVALLIPRLARFGGYALILVMFGAAFTHIRAGEWPNPIFNLVFATGLWWVARNRS